MGALVIGGIALALGEGIVGSLIASGVLKAGGKLWGFSEKELKKEITRASKVAIHHFNASFGGKYFSGGETLEAFFDSPTMRKELGKIVCTDDEEPDVKTLAIAFEEMDGFKMFPDLTEAGFTESMTTSIEKFKTGLANVIECRRNEEKARLKLYKQQVAEYCGQLDFVGIPDPKQKKDLQLEEIFITLRARERRPEGDVLPEEDGEEDETDPRRVRGVGQPRESAPIKLNDALRDNRKLVILGGPGAGKTTMLRYVALMLAKEQADEIGLPDGLIPIFVELNRFASRDKQQQSLLDFACDYANSHMNAELSPNFFKSYLQQGKCVVLLDGLDEVATLSQRVEVSNEG